RRRPERESEPGAGDHRAGDRVARLGLEVTQAYEPAEGDPQQHLGALGADAHDAAERLQIAEQLAEARQMSGPPARAAVASQIERRLRGAAADFVAVAGKYAPHGARGRVDAGGKPHSPDGLLGRAAARPRDARDRDGAIRREETLRPLGHGAYGLLGDGAVRL